jgi:hypothetical protein
MNKYAGIFAASLFLLILIPSVSGVTVVVPIIDGIEMAGNTSRIIEGGNYIVSGGLILADNSSLTLIDAEITFADNEEAEYTVSGNSKLTSINCSIILQSPHSIQASQNASIELVNVELYSTYEVNNRTYFSTGIGLSGNSRIIVEDSKIGFIRLAENAECNVIGSHIGDFGIQSHKIAEFIDSTIERVFLVYERSRVQINQSITGRQEWFTQSQLVKAGENLYDFEMKNTTLLNPPMISITDGKLEARDTWLDIVYIEGDSAIETQNTKIYYLRLMGYSWAIIEDSSIEYMSAWEGDFNIQLKNTTHRRLSTYETAGLNLQTNGTKTDELILDWCVPNTPQNVELHNTEIGDLHLTMYSPQPIQCSDVTIGNLTIESGRGDEPPITLTGSIDFTSDAEINQAMKGGYTCIRRVYLIEATIDNEPAANTMLIIHLENQTKTITTNQLGQAVIPVTYVHQFSLVRNPQPGGPYIITQNNLTRSVTLTLNQQNYTLSILSDTPVVLGAISNTASQRWEPDWSQYTIAAIVITLLAIGLYLYNLWRLEKENRQIQ